MSHKNYSKFSNKKDKHTVSKELEETVLKAGGEVMRVETNENEILKQLIGHVSGCKQLYVRKGPTVNSDYECVINEGTIVKINGEDGEFYKVCTASGIEGYCMKKFITIKI